MNIGFIGFGNMGSAIAKGLYQSSIPGGYRLFAYNPHEEKIRRWKETMGIKEEEVDPSHSSFSECNTFTSCPDIETVVRQSQWILLAVKPQIYDRVLPEVTKFLRKDQIIVSMAAGITIDILEKKLGNSRAILRIMPNLGALQGESMTAIWGNSQVSSEELTLAIGMFEGMGKVEVVEESLFHQVIGTAGSSPAYTFLYIQALMEGAVEGGIPEETARILAAQSVLGAARVVLESDTPLSQLVDQVCSKGGTTIEGVRTLKAESFQEVVKKARRSVIKRSEEMEESS